ncbi:MAG: hypothetical protein BHW48_05385 [Roseburia sp. CAG:10041_57]|nr:MAG: hypothetical protein BHW48_05385 [Roseburia sp. CAG:10041_57]
MNRKEYVDWAVKVLTVVRSVWSTFSGEGASEWRESVHKEFIKTGITPKDYFYAGYVSIVLIAVFMVMGKIAVKRYVQ